MQKVAAFKPPLRLHKGIGWGAATSLARRRMSQLLAGHLDPKFIKSMEQGSAMPHIVFRSTLNTVPG